MEITGFTNDNIAKYVKQFFEQMKDEMEDASIKGQNLLTLLKSNSSIWGVAHIPVNLELICSLWSDNDWSKTKALSITALYDSIIEWLCRRHLSRKNVKHEQKRKKAVYELCEAELHFLEVLAFKAMESNTIILPPKLLAETEKETKYSLDKQPELLNIGILKSYGNTSTSNQVTSEQQHYFVHLSFQEHFAARHFLKTLNTANKQEAINFINDHKYNQRFLLVFVFASGLLAQSDYASLIDRFWSTMQGEPIDLVGLKHVKLIIECTEELADQTVFPQKLNLLQIIAEWLDICTKSHAPAITANLIKSLAHTRSLGNTSIIQKAFVHLLLTENEQTQDRALQILLAFHTIEPLPDLLSPLLALIQPGNLRDISSKAWETLRKIGQKAATNEVITALLNALLDQESHVRTRACKTLANIGEKAATNEFIAALLNALQDQESHVRWGACETLGNIGEKAATNEVITGLLNALQDQDWGVRMRACAALGNIGEKAATNEVITALLNALQNQDWRFRLEACKTLGNIGEKAATNEVITGLLNALQDQDWNVRWEACETLGEIGEKAAT
ncbi:unnamed protein product, partial [Rotaria sp. Silwood2]